VPRDAEASARWRCRSRQHLAPDLGSDRNGGQNRKQLTSNVSFRSAPWAALWTGRPHRRPHS